MGSILTTFDSSIKPNLSVSTSTRPAVVIHRCPHWTLDQLENMWIITLVVVADSKNLLEAYPTHGPRAAWVPLPDMPLRGFCFLRRSRQGALADGPAWAAPKKHRCRRLRRADASRGATPSTAGGGFNSVARGRLKAATTDTAQVNLPLHTSLWGRGWVCREPRDS